MLLLFRASKHHSTLALPRTVASTTPREHSHAQQHDPLPPHAHHQRAPVSSMSAKSIGITDVDISTLEGAQTAIDKIRTAINSVSSTRGDLGAIQNRLEHAINNLGVTTENMTAAESRIRDTDMAQEMMSYTKNNILVQAAQAMLAQANQVPQGVLQLLQ